MDGPAWALVDAALRGALFALLGLLIALLLRDRPRSAGRRLQVAMALGLVIQVIESTPALDSALALVWRTPLIALSMGNAVLFWLLVRSLVADVFVPGVRHALLWLAVVLGVALNQSFVAGGAGSAAPLLISLQRAVPAVFALLSAFAALLHWRADLVEKRRRLRAFVVVTGVAYSLALMAARGLAHGRPSQLAGTLDVLLLLAIVAVVATGLLGFGAAELLAGAATRGAAGNLAPAAPPASAPAALPAPDAAELRLADAVQHAMAVERIYRTEDLTVAGLAQRLAVPEYRLRRLINQRLGHRNFNTYVNGFRLAEACAALADPARRERPILTIALDAGFQSIGPFNRAFKLATGLTPGEFRREKLADS
jgi:AraC-like DNA-binding protein